MFLPAFCLFPVWLTLALREDILVSSVSKYYPMMITMIIGSMIAGSTPLGGGVVAFPVSVLVLGFTPVQGRDFSLMIQSVGMTAASFLIFYKKQHLLGACEDILVQFCVWSIIGMIFGFEFFNASPYMVNIVYTTTVLCIAIILAYSDFIKGPQFTNIHLTSLSCGDDDDHQGTAAGLSVGDVEMTGIGEATDIDLSSEHETKPKKKQDELHEKKCIATLKNICLPLFAISGGILSSQIGTGADIAFYFYGSLYNTIMHRNGLHEANEMSGNALTAASVITMANTSIFGSILRLTTRHDLAKMIDEEVFYALTACAPIVVLGAPVGSLLLTPSNQQWLKYLFYLLSVLQLLLFGVIKIGDDYITWIYVSCLIFSILICLYLHYLFRYRGANKKNLDNRGWN